MKTIQAILCPTDFSPASTAAWKYAQQLAQECGASILLLHAIDGREAAAMEAAQEKLQATVAQYHELNVERVIQGGPAGEVICWLAQDRGCSLIVMGMHGHTAIRDLLVGSVAEYVLRHARIPVLTVRDRPENEPPLAKPEMHLPAPAPRWM